MAATSTTVSSSPQRQEPEAWLREYRAIIHTPTVCSLVTHIAAKLSKDGFVLPNWWNTGRYWHELTYELKKDQLAPEFLKKQRFDWDASYPMSPALRDYLPSMSAHLCMSPIGVPVQIMTQPHIAIQLEELEEFPKEYQEFLKKATALAKERFEPLQKWANHLK